MSEKAIILFELLQNFRQLEDPQELILEINIVILAKFIKEVPQRATK